MPRIRTLKPEALQHRKVGRLSDRAFRLWIALLTQADDEGRLIADAEHLRLLAFGYHPKVRSAHLETALEEIREAGLIRLYSQNGTRYADFPSWSDHQRVSHATPSKFPTFTEGSENSRILQNPPEDSGPRARARIDAPADRIGSDRSDRIGSTPPYPPTGGFTRFWLKYPKRVGKGQAEKAWSRVQADPLTETILTALEAQRGYLERDGGQFIPLPATWLNQRRWEDDPPADYLHTKTKTNVAGVAEWLSQQPEPER